MTVRYPHIILTLLCLIGVALPDYVYADEPERVISIGGNVYGGGESANVGSTEVNINEGRYSKNIFGGGKGEVVPAHDETPEQVTSANVTGATHVTINGGEFAVRHEDERTPGTPIDFAEHYNIYGGGNIASTVGETHVYVTKGMISKDSDGSGLGVHDEGTFLQNSNEKGIAQAYYQRGQMYFCIFGGGYGKNTSVTGNTWVDFNINGMTDINSTAIEDDLLEYQSYLDVIGGGFNGTVQGNTNVHVGGNAMCRDVYGGGLYAKIGTQDDDKKGNTNVYITGGNVDNVYGGGVMGDILTSTNVTIGLHENLNFDGHNHAKENDKITILMSVFGGNDVSGRVETANVNHYGGTIDQDIYGAGNGNYRGYYTPGVCDYADGDNDNYYPVDHSGETSTDGKGTKGPKGDTYKGRPQTGNVNITIAGSSTEDKASVLGQVFGGGNSCTIGNWVTDLNSKYDGDPHKWRDDPAYFLGGGSLSITVGSHVKIGRSHKELVDAEDEEYLNKDGENVSGLFMGCSGKHLATQSTAEDDYTYHHYYDAYTAKYWPGFAVFKDNGEPMNRAEGLAAYNAYLNNILIWSDNVTLTIDNEAEDIWLANFVGGGFRGSMKAKTASGRFAYTLPEGVTIGNAVVGGAYNTDVVYRVFDTESDMHTYTETNGHYNYCTTIKPEWEEGRDYHHVEYAEDGETITGIVRFYYDGGMLAEDNSGNRIHQIHADPRADEDEYATAYFEPLTSGDGAEDEATKAKLFSANKNKSFVYLNLRCALEPEVLLDSEGNHSVHGGNVFGGCFMSGLVQGDSWVDYGAWLSPNCTDTYYFDKTNNMHIYSEAADLVRNNALNVFGAGFGENTHTAGDAYLYIKAVAQVAGGDGNKNGKFPYMFNAFGGSYAGRVYGNTNVYFAVGKQGTLLGSLYGGGFLGDIDGNTFVELAEGFVTNVYGGSRQANIHGASHVWAYDGASRGINDANHLIICNLYGGNDIAGTISGKMPAKFTESKWGTAPTGETLKGKTFNSYVEISADDNSANRGFPLIGSAYAGGNGENWTADKGVQPVIENALLEIDGGSTLRAFGGGNMATVTDSTYIFTNASSTSYANVTFSEYQTNIMENVFFNGVTGGYEWMPNDTDGKPTKLVMDPFHVANLFGGNNLATMTIQPTWNLKKGRIENVYSGGNMGDMTYYNAAPATGKSKGLSITIDSENIQIESLYGGCRMSDVKAMIDATTPAPTFGENDYGATVNVVSGRLGNIYGGNDVSGYVYNGTNVNMSGSVTGNVYGAGNGNYLYAYDKTPTLEHVGDKAIVQEWSDKYNANVYWIPGNASATPLQQMLALNNARPHVEKAYLNIFGTSESKKVYIYGSVYCGGNASTIRPMTDGEHEAHVKFNIGNNAIVNNVFMGSNGESLKYDATHANTYLENFEEVNGLNLATDLTGTDWSILTNENTSLGDRELVSMNSDIRNNLYPSLLSVYMRAVDMKAMPIGFDGFSIHDFQNTWIGTFCMGGNAGSMMTDQPVDIVFPQSLNFFGRIIGGSKDASFQYKGKWHRGGFRMPLAAGAKLDDAPTKTKLRMKIRGDWYSRRMVIEESYKSSDYLAVDKTDDGKTWDPDGKAWGDGCNVYGGCYQSGDMIGDVQIYIESDMLAYSSDRYGTTIDTYTNSELDESNKLNLPVANVYGAGYGPESRNYGDAYIYMKDIPNASGTTHPSVNNIFGGGRNGMLIGNSVIHVHDGLVFRDVVGGSFSAAMYGSAQVTVGYPKFYVCKQTGEYFLDRADKWNEGYTTKGNNGNDQVIKKSIKYFKGTYVPCNVYDKITGVKVYNNNTPGGLTDIKSYLQTNKETNSDYFEFHNEGANPDDTSIFPQGGWENVEIRVRGGVYGGGYSLSNSTSAVAGSYTTLASTEQYNHGNDDRGNSSVGFGGNSSIIISDLGTGTIDHIKISTENPVVNKIYSGTGGIYGDGRLVFCEGFRTAELNGYGYAGSTISEPLMLNSMQRLDLLTINDCCFKLYGDQDFATDQYDARKYSLARIGEMSMNSSIEQTGNLGATRNYIAFYNNIHYLGSIITNDDFRTAKFHDHEGNVNPEQTYYEKKQEYIKKWYASDKQTVAENTFKQRNYATARNMVGINSGYCLRVENQYYEGEEKKTYYGPIVGVCEMKLLNVQPGEGGGYVYADNVHADIYESGHSSSDATFMNESGNFVFPSMVRPGEGEAQYIVDDCLPQGFDDWKAGRAVHSDLPEQHYWYVIGDTYYYNATLTAFSYKTRKDFDLTTSDPNVIFAGIEEGSDVTLESVIWQPATYPAGYSGDIRGGRDGALAPLAGSDEKYKFTLQIGNGDTWSQDMPRSATDETETIDQEHKPTKEYAPTGGNPLPSSPQFNVHLIDNVNNCPEGQEEEYYNDHLSVPERVLLQIKSSKAGQPTKTYNVTLDIVYIQGPSFTGEVTLRNCALPGEKIEFSSDGIEIKTTDQLPLTGFAWKLVPITREELVDGNMVYEWDAVHGAEVIPESSYTTALDGSVDGTIPALYNHNHWNVFFTFTAAGETFTVEPTKDKAKDLSERMIVVHNYHRMKDITPHNIEESVVTGARVYIEDVEDLNAFQTWVNAGKATEGVNFILQDNLTLPATWSITQPFHGTFHGDGYLLNASSVTGTKTLFGSQLTGMVYNLGMLGGTISSVDTKNVTTCLVNGTHTVNSYEYDMAKDPTNFYFKYGKDAYDLSHYFTPSTEGGATIVDGEGNADPTLGYVYNYYANGDYQYARHTDDWSLRTAESPNYGSTNTYHDTEHTHDAKRWNNTQKVNIPLHSRAENAIYNGATNPYENDYLFFGQHLDMENANPYPVHINPVANGDADGTKGGNRVYGTKAYYNEGQGTHDYIHFNADAWAFQPEGYIQSNSLIKHEEVLTSIDFTQRTSYSYKVDGNTFNCAETDDCPVTLYAFHVDSNADYDADGNERGSAAYTNRGYQHVTQNLLVAHNDDDADRVIFAEGHYGNNIPESDIRYHAFNTVYTKDKYNNDVLSHFTTQYLHLVDYQDFFAAIDKEHRISERAWYERQPLAYRNVTAGYEKGSAWEGLALPFPVDLVRAEKNGIISHFYGTIPNEGVNDRTLHHEYWLRGLTGMEVGGETLANFERPGKDGTGELYWPLKDATPKQTTMDYNFPANSYFTSLYDYNSHYDTRDDEGDDTMGYHDKAWYAEDHTFADYVPIAANVPYIVAFPGDDFYEFSMESFYKTDTYGKTSYAQKVTFDGMKDNNGNVTFKKSPTDKNIMDDFVVNSDTYSHVGVFSHKQEKGKCVLNENIEGEVPIGSYFKNEALAYPFRTYFELPKTKLSAPGICLETRAHEWFPEEETEPSTESLKVYAREHILVVESNYETDLRVYNLSGQYIRTLHVQEGINQYKGFHQGIYIVGNHKVAIRQK